MITVTNTATIAKATLSLVALAATLTGCSQVQGLATQGNMNVIYLESAVTDVLLSQKVALMGKPTCTVDTSTNYSCTGTTLTGESIAVQVPGTDEDPIMTISVNGKQVFHGSVIQVIDENAQVNG